MQQYISGLHWDGEVATDELIVAARTDRDAMRKVIQKTIKYGVYVAKKCGINDVGDYLADITEGIVRAVNTFDPGKGSWLSIVRPHVTYRVNAHRNFNKSVVSKTGYGDSHRSVPVETEDGDDVRGMPFYENCMEESFDRARMVRRLRLAAADLDQRERRIFYMVIGGQSLAQCGNLFDISRERARQLFNRSMKHICESIGVEYSRNMAVRILASSSEVAQ